MSLMDLIKKNEAINGDGKDNKGYIEEIRAQIRNNPIAFSYNTLDVSDFSRHRINHSEKFVKDTNHINGKIFGIKQKEYSDQKSS